MKCLKCEFLPKFRIFGTECTTKNNKFKQMKKALTSILLLFSLLAIAQTVPYNVNKRKFPLGDEFEKILPTKLGKWNRYAFHDFVPGMEPGNVYYTQGDNQIYLTFGKAYTSSELNISWLKLYNDVTEGRTRDIKQKSADKSTIKYILIDGRAGYLYAWTRNLYFFSIEAKNKQLADEFMNVFPY